MTDRHTHSSTEDARNRLRTNGNNPITQTMTTNANADESGEDSTESDAEELAPAVREEIAVLLAQAHPFSEDELQEMTADQLRYLLGATEAEDLLAADGDDVEDGEDSDADRQNATDGDPQGYGNDMFTDGGDGEQRANAAEQGEGLLSSNLDGEGKTLAEWEAEEPGAGSPDRRAQKAKQKREDRANRRRQDRSRTNYAGVAGEFDRDVQAEGETEDRDALAHISGGTMSDYEARTNATDAEADAVDDDDDDLPSSGTMSDYEDADVTPSWQTGRSEGAEKRLNAARRASRQN